MKTDLVKYLQYMAEYEADRCEGLNAVCRKLATDEPEKTEEMIALVGDIGESLGRSEAFFEIAELVRKSSQLGKKSRRKVAVDCQPTVPLVPISVINMLRDSQYSPQSQPHPTEYLDALTPDEYPDNLDPADYSL